MNMCSSDIQIQEALALLAVDTVTWVLLHSSITLLLHLQQVQELLLVSQMPLIHEHLSSPNQIFSLSLHTITCGIIASALDSSYGVYILALFRNALLSEGKDYNLLICAPSFRFACIMDYVIDPAVRPLLAAYLIFQTPQECWCPAHAGLWV